MFINRVIKLFISFLLGICMKYATRELFKINNLTLH